MAALETAFAESPSEKCYSFVLEEGVGDMQVTHRTSVLNLALLNTKLHPKVLQFLAVQAPNPHHSPRVISLKRHLHKTSQFFNAATRLRHAHQTQRPRARETARDCEYPGNCSLCSRGLDAHELQSVTHLQWGSGRFSVTILH